MVFELALTALSIMVALGTIAGMLSRGIHKQFSEMNEHFAEIKSEIGKINHRIDNILLRDTPRSPYNVAE